MQINNNTRYFPLRALSYRLVFIAARVVGQFANGVIATTKIIAFPLAVYRVLSVCGGQPAIWVEVLIVCLVVQHVPDGYEQLARHSHEDFHLVFLADLCLIVGETAEEASLSPARSPGALNDRLPKERVAVGYPA